MANIEDGKNIEVPKETSLEHFSGDVADPADFTTLFDNVSSTARLLKEAVDECLKGLTPREKIVIIGTHGLDGEKVKTLEELGKEIGRSPRTVDKIKARALVKLRHPSSEERKKIIDYLGADSEDLPPATKEELDAIRKETPAERDAAVERIFKEALGKRPKRESNKPEETPEPDKPIDWREALSPKHKAELGKGIDEATQELGLRDKASSGERLILATGEATPALIARIEARTDEEVSAIKAKEDQDFEETLKDPVLRGQILNVMLSGLRLGSRRRTPRVDPHDPRVS